MEYPELKDKIIILLEKIIERNNFLKKDEKISLLEIDLLMQDMRTLYDVYSQVRLVVTEKQSISEPDTNKEPSAQNNEEVEASRTSFNTDKKEVDKENTKVEEQFIAVEQKDEYRVEKAEEESSKEETPELAKESALPADTDNTIKVSSEKDTTDNEVKEAKKNNIAEKHEAEEKVPIGEKLGSAENSLHDKISGSKEDTSIGAKMQQKSIHSLKEAIDVNEKFSFINELFNGNIQAYNEAIEKLNGFNSINEAFEYINVLTADFSWDGNRSASTIEKFAGLVQRRYMNN